MTRQMIRRIFGSQLSAHHAGAKSLRNFPLLVTALAMALAFVAWTSPRAQAANLAPQSQQQSSQQTSSAKPPAQTPSSAAQNATSAQPQPSVTAGNAASNYITVPTGTRIPLVLHNSISTRTAQAGDPVYLETLFPILIGDKIVIPAGSYVSGVVTEAKRPGRVHGRGSLTIRLNNLILPNGYEASFNATPADVGTGGKETVDKSEGSIKGAGNKAGDAATIAETTVTGTEIGGIAGAATGNIGRGLGIGAGAGAAAGLLAVLLTRGPDAQLPRGSTLEIALNRPLYLLSSKINFTSPGHSSTLPAPPDRTSGKYRNRFPY